MNKIYFVFVVGMMAVLSGCSDDDPSPAKERKVTYEITGNFSGKLLIVYTDPTGGNTTLADVALPWSLEVTYPASVPGVGIGSQASVTGGAGQTAKLKIIVNGKEVKSGSATAGTLGELVLPTLAYTF